MSSTSSTLRISAEQSTASSTSPLGAVDGLEVHLQGRVAADLARSEREASQHGGQRLNRKCSREWLARPGLSVEFAAILDPRREMPEGYIELGRQVDENRSNRLFAMHMLVRIQMRGVSSDE